MSRYNVAIERLGPVPARIARLPIDERGFPVPRFVEWIDGRPDFRVMNARFLRRAVSAKLCWLCGEPLGRFQSFVIGPMCAINRISAEPPSHLACAQFAARACPFLTQPKRPRNDHDLPELSAKPPGTMIARNPGVTLIWTTEAYKVRRDGDGLLFDLVGSPTSLHWFSHGRHATREEIMAAIDSGLPLLRGMAEREGPEAVAELGRQIERGLALVP